MPNMFGTLRPLTPSGAPYGRCLRQQEGDRWPHPLPNHPNPDEWVNVSDVTSVGTLPGFDSSTKHRRARSAHRVRRRRRLIVVDSGECRHDPRRRDSGARRATVSMVATSRIGELESVIRALSPGAEHAWRARNNRSGERVTILLTQYAHLWLRARPPTSGCGQAICVDLHE